MKKIAFVLLAILAGCKTPTTPDVEEPQVLYKNAVTKIQASQTRTGLEDLNTIMSQYPFGEWAEKAQLAEIYAHFKLEEYAQASASADRFIELNPRHPLVDYAYYMRGVVEFYRALGFSERYLPLKRAQRDIVPAQDAFKHLAQLIQHFPSSKYAPDAYQRLIFLREMIAEHHLNILKFYKDRKIYVAAIERGNVILTELAMTQAARQATTLVAECYEALGEPELAKQYRGI